VQNLLPELHTPTNKEPLSVDEVQLIKGTLQLTTKKVRDCMTPLARVFALEQATLLDADTLARIRQRGHSRIPVYNGTPDAIVGVLLIKALVGQGGGGDTDAAPVRVRDCKLRSLVVLDASYSLYDALHTFQTGKSHLAAIRERSADGLDHIVGIVTMEDILEELLLAEIHDETDLDKLRHCCVFTANPGPRTAAVADGCQRHALSAVGAAP